MVSAGQEVRKLDCKYTFILKKPHPLQGLSFLISKKKCCLNSFIGLWLMGKNTRKGRESHLCVAEGKGGAQAQDSWYPGHRGGDSERRWVSAREYVPCRVPLWISAKLNSFENLKSELAGDTVRRDRAGGLASPPLMSLARSFQAPHPPSLLTSQGAWKLLKGKSATMLKF